MKQESMKVLFFIRKSRLKKNGEAPQQRERSEFNGIEQLYRGIESKAVPDSQGTSL